ncbi:DUF6443 domain-containing protein [Pedobacter sp. B4-66]|uniref:DUF6443 domain-containing protein n=1 Tax=Pedobacter sp. B4-66 TaxID=2817280 RepID=UPI001BD9EADD|nr:DUF6443 domain-containing protein [Pedobacter sp. B4-66]
MKTYYRLLLLLAILLFSYTKGFSQSMTISYPASQTYTVGTAITPLSPTMTGGPAASAGQTITFAGTGSAGSTNGAGTSATFNNTLNTAVDASGNVYVADAGNHMVRKITPAGVVSTLAGSGLPGYADGTGATAVFKHPSALTVDAGGNVFVSDQQNHRIRKITPAGVVTTVAGSGTAGATEGTGTGASFSSPIGLALDASGNLYVSDYGNNKIRKITTIGLVSTFAGTGAQGLTNGAALSATFKNPMGIAIDASGTMYVADRQNYVVRKISGGTVSTLAGSGVAGSADGTGTAASFNRPNAVTVDATGNVYIADDNNMVVRKITPAGVVTILAGAAGTPGFVNGTGANARFNSPYGLSVDAMGYLYVADQNNYSIRKTVTKAYSINPALPAGLFFNETNGTISGTPTVVSAATNYQIQAFNVTHSSNVATISITVSTGVVSAVLPSQDQNYMITYTPRTELLTESAVIGATSDRTKVQANIQYFDGLGRPLQNVEWKGSPNMRDLVTPIVYDAYGREDKKYLPYTTTAVTSNGSYKTTAITDQNSFYTSPSSTTWTAPGVVTIPGNAAVSKTILEASPLSRVLEQGAPGTVWQPGTRTATTGRSVVASYGANNSTTAYSTTGFAVRLYTATASATVGLEHVRTLGGTTYYGANQLYLTITKDENWTGIPAADVKLGTTEEYKDKEGRVILKRTFNKVSTTIQTLSTYYVYDDFGNLSFVLPPGANPDAAGVLTLAVLDNFCYQYRYDGRKRLIQKKLPGKGWEELIYNKLNQVVFTADTVQRVALKRNFIKYDGLGRVILTGVEKGHDQTRAFIQNSVDNQIIRWEERDNSGFQGYTNVSNPMNYPQFEVSTVNYYDDYTAPGIPNNQSASYSNKTKGLLTASKVAVIGTSTFLWTVNYYNDEGRIAKVWQQHYKGGVVAANSYDETINTYNNITGELTGSVRRHFVAGAEKLNVSNRFTYDHMGRLKDTYQKTGDVAATPNAEILLSRNTYNEIGQLSSKGLHSTNLTTPAFAQTVAYSYNARGWLKSQSAPLFAQELKYELDSVGLVAQYNGNISRQKWGINSSLNKQYTYTYDKQNRLLTALSSDGNDETIAYDVMGNITYLDRKSLTAAVDQLTYSYTGTGNKLNSIVDANTNAVASFQLPGTTAYTYDLNGNMTGRNNAASTGNNLTGITYNHLNLPVTLTAGGSAITYTYDTNGAKLRKVVTGTSSLNNDYISGIQYETGVLKFMSTSEGRVVRNSATSYSYEYTLTDHLGNGRVYFDINGTVARKIQEVDYYAYGLDIQRSLIGTENKYQYNGKEKQDQEKLLDYGARFYDPVIGRWSVIDPLAEQDRSWSLYNYARNNAIRFIDPDGMFFREYEDEEAYRKDNPNGKLDGKDGHWLKSDRENNTDVWDKANETNIQKSDGHNEYANLDQRADFYRWFQSETDSRGFETRWAGAAASTVDKLKNLLGIGASMTGYSNDEIKNFVKSGNKLILDDVWGGLQSLYNGDPIKGSAAGSWDGKQLLKEQNIINNSYWNLSNKSLTILDNSLKKNYFLSKFIPGPVFQGNLLSIQDRWKYGMGMMNYKSLPKLSPKYKNQ